MNRFLKKRYGFLALILGLVCDFLAWPEAHGFDFLPTYADYFLAGQAIFFTLGFLQFYFIGYAYLRNKA
jgi:hypothetical protein